MIGNEKRQGLCRLGSVLIFTLLLALGLAVSFDTYYDLNDDTVIKDIISGTYTGTPSGYSIQMLYPLSFLLAVLYTAIPGVAWYGLFLCLCQFGALAVIAWRITGIVKAKKLQIGLLVVEAVVAAGLLVRNFVFVQYSVTSGLCMAAAIFWYITGEKETDWLSALRQNAISLVWIWMAFCIRTELCIMLLPFLLVAGLVKWLSEEKIFTAVNVKKYIILIMTALAGMLVLWGIDNCAYGSSEWKSFRAFFDARTDLYDFYGIPDYEKNRELYQELGLSRESYDLLQNYNFSLDKEINTEVMQRLAVYQEQQAKQGQGLYTVAGLVTRNSPRQALWSYKEHLLNDTPYLVFAAYILYFLLAYSRRKSGCYWKLLLLFGVRSVVWFYLFMVDRTPERITTPLILAELIVLTGWLMEEFRIQYVRMTVTTSVKKLFDMKLIGTIAIFLLCGATALMFNVEQTGQEYEKRITANKRWDALNHYCETHKENYYVVDVYSSTSYQGAAYSEKIFKDVDNSYRNFDICGGWASKSPLMYEKLLQSGVEDLQKDLAAVEGNTLFVAACDKDVSWLVEYYSSKEMAVEINVVDTIWADMQEAFYVYQLYAVD